MPLFSIVLTTYRRPDRLVDALSSVQAQTERDFEVVVMNNDAASADAVDSVAARFDLPIRVIHNEENLGQSASRNRGVELSNANLIALLDDDDTWMPNFLERHRTRHEDDPGLGLVYCGHYVVWSDIPLGPRAVPAVPPPPDLFTRILRGDLILAANSILTIKRDAYLDLGGYDSKMSGFPDWDFEARLSRVQRFGHIPEPLVNFGVQLSGRDSDPEKRTPELEVVKQKWGEYPEVGRFIGVVRRQDLYRASFADFFSGRRARGIARLAKYAFMWGPGWEIGLVAKGSVLAILGPSAYAAIQRRRNAGT